MIVRRPDLSLDVLEIIRQAQLTAPEAQVLVVADIEGFRTDHPDAIRIEHHGLEADRRDIKAQAPTLCIAPLEAEHVEIELVLQAGLQARRHRARVDHAEVGEAALGQWQRHQPRLVAGQHTLEVPHHLLAIKRQRAELGRLRCFRRQVAVGGVMPVMVGSGRPGRERAEYAGEQDYPRHGFDELRFHGNLPEVFRIWCTPPDTTSRNLETRQ